MKKVAEGLFELPGGSLERGYLVGSCCSNCGCISYPTRIICPDCLMQDTMAKMPLSRTGRLYSYAVNQVAPEGFTAPYIIGKVDLPEHVRVFAILTGSVAEEDRLSIGMEMEIVFEALKKDKTGQDVVGYKFRPVDTAVENKNG